MGTDPRTSVVDANCRVHGVSNLYIASCAVFPTSSQANPTLTLVALAVRLAAHLRTTPAGNGPVAVRLPGSSVAARTLTAAPDATLS
jgi:choline dehydrogenase-like flavoprotein